QPLEPAKQNRHEPPDVIGASFDQGRQVDPGAEYVPLAGDDPRTGVAPFEPVECIDERFGQLDVERISLAAGYPDNCHHASVFEFDHDSVPIKVAGKRVAADTFSRCDAQGTMRTSYR